jgi:hypothetical protein
MLRAEKIAVLTAITQLAALAETLAMTSPPWEEYPPALKQALRRINEAISILNDYCNYDK